MTTMYDSDNPDAIPSGVLAAGYISGYAAPAWLSRGFARFPHARRINVTPLIDGGDTFDVENGDLLPWEAPDAVQKARARGVKDPWVYLSYDLWAPTKTEFHLRGIPEPLWWIALYDAIPTLLPGAIAKQYADPARIPNHPHYDLSVVADGAFGAGSSDLTGAIPTGGKMLTFRPSGPGLRFDMAWLLDGRVWRAWGPSFDQLYAASNPAGSIEVPDLAAVVAGIKVAEIIGFAWNQDGSLCCLAVVGTDGLLYGQQIDINGGSSGWRRLGASGSPSLQASLPAAPTVPDNDAAYVLEADYAKHTHNSAQTGPPV